MKLFSTLPCYLGEVCMIAGVTVNEEGKILTPSKFISAESNNWDGFSTFAAFGKLNSHLIVDIDCLLVLVFPFDGELQRFVRTTLRAGLNETLALFAFGRVACQILQIYFVKRRLYWSCRLLTPILRYLTAIYAYRTPQSVKGTEGRLFLTNVFMEYSSMEEVRRFPGAIKGNQFAIFLVDRYFGRIKAIQKFRSKGQTDARIFL